MFPARVWKPDETLALAFEIVLEITNRLVTLPPFAESLGGICWTADVL